jgi:hypothetical protein
MEQPKFFFQKKDGEIALMAQFIPTFESQQPQDLKICETSDEIDD